MLDGTITISVDVANDANLVDAVFTRQDEFQNRSKYKSANHSLISRDTLDFYRTYPKKSGNFNGTAKSSLKFTRDRTVNGVDATTEVVAPEIVEISFSLPVGITNANLVELRQRVVALLDDDSIMDRLNEGLEV